MNAVRPIVWLVLVVVGAGVASCRAPTTISVLVTTDFDCKDLRGVVIAVGTLGDGLDQRPPTSTSDVCVDRRAGRLVVVPTDANDVELGIRVVGGFGRDVSECSGPNPGKGCIVARRALHYLPHTDLTVPIVLRASCDGVACGATQTCVSGGCTGAIIGDAQRCASATGCDESTLPPGACGGKEGPSSVVVDGKFCIDSTEVTNADYAKFLAQKPPTSLQPAGVCDFNTTFTPGAGWPATGGETLPVVNVDWCDAYAYCAWAGKHLCGRVGGGEDNPTDVATITNELYYACSRGGTRAYPYGDTYDPKACNGNEASTTVAVLPVKSLPTCEGGFSGLFDLSGNVAEWQDACETKTGPNDRCRQGAWGLGLEGTPSSTTQLRCDAFAADDRAQQFPDLGIRCCGELK